jgi:hypothetical protein
VSLHMCCVTKTEATGLTSELSIVRVYICENVLVNKLSLHADETWAKRIERLRDRPSETHCPLSEFVCNESWAERMERQAI